jgi:hypothetical protein
VTASTPTRTVRLWVTTNGDDLLTVTPTTTGVQKTPAALLTLHGDDGLKIEAVVSRSEVIRLRARLARWLREEAPHA